MTINSQRQRGFTLVELAVVLVLIGIAMTMGLKMVVSTLENAAYSETKSKQERIKLALIGFLRTNGRLPCPDSTAIPTGDEPVSCKASLAEGYGVLPWKALGMPRDAVQDGWGNFFTYRVANGKAFASPNTFKNWTAKLSSTDDFTVDELLNSNPASDNSFTISQLNAAGNLESLTSKAVVVVVSHGKNGFGAKTIKVAAPIPTTDASADEITNASILTNFVLRPVTESFDDLLAYMLPQDLLQPLLNEGSLKTCRTYCPIIPTCTAGVFTCTSGTGFCTGSGPSCTSSGTVSCTLGGVPQCTLPSTGCLPSNIPIGANPATCK